MVTKHKNARNDLQFWASFPFCCKNALSQLKDLLVLELSSVLAGPAVGQFFAELGARVIKVENLRTSGDVTRSWKSNDERTDDRSAYFCAVNWGKQSIAIDLSTAAGRSIVHQLASAADIVIASYKPGDAEKLGVDYRTLSQDHPELIYGQITGYGSHNYKVGYDAIIQAEAGFMSMNGEPGGQSLKIPVALMDILASHQLKEGILLAMLEKQSTGKGKLVDVSLIQTAVASLANQATNFLVAGKIPSKQGSAHPNIAPYGDIFTTADAKEILLAVGTDKQFVQLSKILKISDISNISTFETNVQRVRNRTQLKELLQEAIGKMNADDLVQKLEREKIPGGLIRNVEEAINHPDVQDILFSNKEFSGVRTYVANSASISNHLSPPPHLGEHTMEVLTGLLKISPTAAEKLVSARIIQ